MNVTEAVDSLSAMFHPSGTTHTASPTVTQLHITLESSFLQVVSSVFEKNPVKLPLFIWFQFGANLYLINFN